jgi:hypothetical protein
MSDFSIVWDSSSNWVKMLSNTTKSFEALCSINSNPNSVVGSLFSSTPYMLSDDSNFVGREIWLNSNMNAAPSYVPALGADIGAIVKIDLSFFDNGDLVSYYDIQMRMFFIYGLLNTTPQDGSTVKVIVSKAGV